MDEPARQRPDQPRADEHHAAGDRRDEQDAQAREGGRIVEADERAQLVLPPVRLPQQHAAAEHRGTSEHHPGDALVRRHAFSTRELAHERTDGATDAVADDRREPAHDPLEQPGAREQRRRQRHPEEESARPAARRSPRGGPPVPDAVNGRPRDRARSRSISVLRYPMSPARAAAVPWLPSFVAPNRVLVAYAAVRRSGGEATLLTTVDDHWREEATTAVPRRRTHRRATSSTKLQMARPSIAGTRCSSAPSASAKTKVQATLNSTMALITTRP